MATGLNCASKHSWWNDSAFVGQRKAPQIFLNVYYFWTPTNFPIYSETNFVNIGATSLFSGVFNTNGGKHTKFIPYAILYYAMSTGDDTYE